MARGPAIRDRGHPAPGPPESTRLDNWDAVRQFATGAALAAKLLVEGYPHKRALIDMSPIAVAAQKVLAAFKAGHELEPSYEIAVHLAWLNEIRAAGAVYEAYWTHAAARDKDIRELRARVTRKIAVGGAVDARKRAGREVASKIEKEFWSLVLETTGSGRTFVVKSQEAVARLLARRLHKQGIDLSVRTIRKRLAEYLARLPKK